MPKLKAKALRQETAERLRSLLGATRGDLHSRRTQALAGKLKDVKEIRKIRKEIARMLTVLKEKYE